MADKAAKLLEQKRRFAALYSNGTEATRSNWAECNRLVGASFVESDIELRAMIEDEGGMPPGLMTTSLGEVKAEPRPAKPGTANEDWRAKLAAAKPQSQDEWCKLAAELRPVMIAIAEGGVKASAAQASTLRHVFDRCFGKVQEKQSDKKPASGVLILPMLGSGPAATVCPRCGFELETHDGSKHAPGS